MKVQRQRWWAPRRCGRSSVSAGVASHVARCCPVRLEKHPTHLGAERPARDGEEIAHRLARRDNGAGLRRRVRRQLADERKRLTPPVRAERGVISRASDSTSAIWTATEHAPSAGSPVVEKARTSSATGRARSRWSSRLRARPQLRRARTVRRAHHKPPACESVASAILTASRWNSRTADRLGALANQRASTAPWRTRTAVLRRMPPARPRRNVPPSAQCDTCGRYFMQAVMPYHAGPCARANFVLAPQALAADGERLVLVRVPRTTGSARKRLTAGAACCAPQARRLRSACSPPSRIGRAWRDERMANLLRDATTSRLRRRRRVSRARSRWTRSRARRRAMQS